MSYKIYDLSQPFSSGSTMWPRIAPDVQIGRSPFPGIYGTPNNHPGWPIGPRWPASLRGGFVGYSGNLHPATHIDAPIYCKEDGISVDKIPLENCYGTGVVVDFRYMKKWDRITAADFEKATPKIEPGDFVVVNTGWQKWYKVQDYVYYHHYPGLVPSAAEWLIEKKIKAISGTWPTLDHSLAFAPLEKLMPWLNTEYKTEIGKDPIEEFPDYEPCLPRLLEAGITCIQNAGGDIDQVTGMRCSRFFALPIRHAGGVDASMTRLVAIFEE